MTSGSGPHELATGSREDEDEKDATARIEDDGQLLEMVTATATPNNGSSNYNATSTRRMMMMRRR